MLSSRQYLVFLSLSFFIVLFFVFKHPGSGFFDSSISDDGQPPQHKSPDFGQYTILNTLSKQEFPIDDPNRRIIIVGDIHGMIGPLNDLLKKVEYSPSSDVLIHVGDILTKSLPSDSMKTLNFMAMNNITGVRGNHDQKVIEWRSWIRWISSFRGGSEWLLELERRWEKELAKNKAENVLNGSDASNEEDTVKSLNPRKWLRAQIKHFPQSIRYLWRLIPEDWVMFSDHYGIARTMTEREFRYLLDLPLVLHVPHAHTFIAHAGILSSDIRYDYWDQVQPLAKLPSRDGKSVEEMRFVQESWLLDIEQNKDPWVLLNMRSVVGDKVVSDTKGKAWTKLWKRDMKSCVGFSDIHGMTKDSSHPLPCYPASVIYGHAAARGLDVKRWSFGLDSGCVYNRKLSALIIGGQLGKDGSPIVYDEYNDETDEDVVDSIGDQEEDEEKDPADNDIHATKNKKSGSIVRFGEHSKARIVTVDCRN